jgi:rhodanese-related sulfurtransferase
MAKSISPEDLQELLDQNQEITLIDVRRKTDYDASPQKIREADWRDPEKIGEWINTLPKDGEVVVYCVKGGSVSQSVVEQLENKYYNVKFVEGGIKAWKEMAGLTE